MPHTMGCPWLMPQAKGIMAWGARGRSPWPCGGDDLLMWGLLLLIPMRLDLTYLSQGLIDPILSHFGAVGMYIR
jgi:hypothetical protein